MLKGTGASQGYGIGRAVIIRQASLDYSNVKYTNEENERSRLKGAIDEFTSRTRALCEKIKVEAGKGESEILEGHIAMINDPFMIDEMNKSIDSGDCAESALDRACTMFYRMFISSDDELTRQRASDVNDIRDSILKILLNVKSVDISSVPEGTVLVANDLTPSMTSQINRKNVFAIVTEVGGITSHSAILARAMGIPAVLSVPDAVEIISDGDMLICDGTCGEVMINPSDDIIAKYTEMQSEYLAQREKLKAFIGRQTVTSSGVKKLLYGNIGKPDEVQSVIQCDGEGIGLFRTEFLFMDRSHEPDEEEQLEAYSTVARAMDSREVIIRTLDIGGDKDIPYLSIEREDNAFLGHRAIRFCLDNPSLFKKQLRAILRSAVFGDVKIMLPLVTTLDEVKRAKALICECERELADEGRQYRSVPLGVMIETPSAALISDLLAREVDFFSIGTNDLTGYIMAVDRGNARVSALYDAMSPAVLRAIEMTIKNAKAAGIQVGMCGEGASDSRLVPLLVEWGLDEFSVTPSSILQVRKIISECK